MQGFDEIGVEDVGSDWGVGGGKRESRDWPGIVEADVREVEGDMGLGVLSHRLDLYKEVRPKGDGCGDCGLTQLVRWGRGDAFS